MPCGRIRVSYGVAISCSKFERHKNCSLDGRKEVFVTSSRFPPRLKRRLFPVAIAAAVTLAGAAGYYRYRHGAQEKPVSAPPPIPVSVAAAIRQDVPIHLSGLGTVQALNTVPIHSQVDGQLMQIAFTEGQRVKTGEVLAKIDPRLFQAALDQAVAKKAQDEANLVSAEKDLTRAKTLVVRSFETQQVVDQQQAKVDALKASLNADDASIEGARTQLDYTTITSPIDGRAGIRQIDLGRIIHANDSTPLVVLTQTQPAAVVFTLPEINLEPLREAMERGPVEVTAFDQNNIKALGIGKLLLIDVVIDQATATIRLKALFPNTDERLWPGEFVNARALVGTESNALTIPLAALQRGPNGLFTWVIGADDKAQMRPIKTGPPADDVAIVADGLEAAERVVTEGYYRLQPGARVAIRPPKERAAAISAAQGRAP
jgi:membrane fusion protein, multidrug efflux system